MGNAKSWIIMKHFGKDLKKLMIMKNNYSFSKYACSKSWTEMEDRFILCMLQKFGLNRGEIVFEDIKKIMRNAPQFRFDWYIKSRTTVEISKRSVYLLNIIEKEYRSILNKNEEEEKIKKVTEKDLDYCIKVDS